MGLRLDQQFQWGDSPLQSDLRKFTQALELRFIPLESKLIDWKAAVDSLTSVGLDRLNTTLGPLLVRIQQAANLGFLVAIADNQTQTLVVDSPIGFFVTSEGKELFRPTPWLLISDNGDSTNWGLGQLQIYNEVTGELTVTMRYAAKTQAGTSWSISDNSGVIPVINAALSDAIDARDAAVAAEATVTASIGDLEELIAIVQSGPVISVAGHAGAVTLGVADIVGLTDALAAKAVGTEVSSALAGKQTASAKLTTMAGVTWAADNLLLLTGPTSCGTIALSAFIKSLLDDADLPAALTTLGIAKASSAEVKTGTDDAKFVTPLGLAAAYVTKDLITNTQSDSYTLQAADNGKMIRMTKATANVLTLPNSLPVNFNCAVEQAGAGIVTFTPATGATRNSRGARTKSNGQFSIASLYVTANSDNVHAVYTLAGDLTT